MNEKENLSKWVNKIKEALSNQGELLKSQGLINDYKIESSEENFSVAEDGVLEYDLHIKQKLVPKKSAEYVELEFKILKEGGEF